MKATVLFVDDDVRVLRSIERIVLHEQYVSRCVTSAKQALELIENEHVDVVVSDMKMPVMDGLTFLRRIKDIHPGIVRVVLSGFSMVSQVLAAVNNGEVFRFLMKPLNEPDEFRQVLRASIEHARALQQVSDMKLAVKSFVGNVPALLRSVTQISEALLMHSDDGNERRILLAQLDQKRTEVRKLFNALQNLEAADERE